jgi:hypothetical protein
MFTVFDTLLCQRRLNVGPVFPWVPRNPPARARPVDAARGCKRRSAHAQRRMDGAVRDAQMADEEFPGTGDGLRSSWCTDSLAPVALRIH